MKPSPKKIVLCHGARTPVGHISRSLTNRPPQELLEMAVRAIFQKFVLPKEAVDGLIAGWVGQAFYAPNIARVVLLKCGLPEKAQAVTVQNNCISSIEAVASAARFILMGEGELYIAGGTESMSRLPYMIEGSRALKELRNLQTVRDKWESITQNEEICVADSLEEGLTDPVRRINMAGTAEICAQMYGISREAQDRYALESFKRTIEAWNRGFYNSHVVSARENGTSSLEKDEYPFLREEVLNKPRILSKAPLLFDNSSYSIRDFYRDFGKYISEKRYVEGKTQGTVTLFNSCGRSDGAAALIVASQNKAEELGLEILGELKSWAFYGNDPAHMGVSPALAAPLALERAGVSFDQLDQIELHEPFAATVLSVFRVGKEKFGHDWQAKYESGALNPNGGSIAIGHPLGATGTRLLLNLLYGLRTNPKARYGLIASCAGGGMGGALVVEKYQTK